MKLTLVFKKLGLIALLFVFGHILAGTSQAQGSLPPEAHIGFLDVGAFYQTEGGVIRIVNAVKALNAEFQPEYDTLEGLKKKIETIKKELEQDQFSSVPMKVADRQQKADEASRLQLEIQYKSEAAQANFNRREQEVMAPILTDIEKALGEFAKQKGLTLILDTRNLSDAQVLIFVEPANEITKDFIGFYNARPATGAVKTP